MTTKLTASERVRRRAARHPEESPAELAAAIGCSRQLAIEALKNTGKVGVPRGTFRLFVAAPLALEPYLDAFMRDGGYSSRSEAVLAFLESGLVPRRERKAYEERRDADD